MQDKPVYAGFAPRLSAWIIDWIITGAALTIIKLPFFILKLVAGDVPLFRELIFTFSAYDIIFYLLGKTYFILLTYFTGSTLGKKCMRLKVIAADESKLTLWNVIYRETIGRYLSALVVNIGYLIIIVDEEKRGFHDRLADTRVVYSFTVTDKKTPEPDAPDIQIAEIPDSLPWDSEDADSEQ